ARSEVWGSPRWIWALLALALLWRTDGKGWPQTASFAVPPLQSGWRPWAEQVEALVGAPTPLHSCQQAAALQTWVQKVVVGHNLCPWAADTTRTGSLALVSLEEESEEELAAQILGHAQLLADAEPPEGQGGATTMLVAPRCPSILDFEAYLELCAWVEEALEDSGLDGVVQLARFHPDFQFADSLADGASKLDAADFVGRSPFPAFHLLREQEVSAALDGFERKQSEEEEDDREAAGRTVAERNSRFLRRRGVEACLRDLSDCLPSEATS
ncbi:unnamed protein product, partial [Polarella glacialis]